MKTAVIDQVEGLNRILDACEVGGIYKIASISNRGVVRGAVRVTILPVEAFEPGAPTSSRADWVRMFHAMIHSGETLH